MERCYGPLVQRHVRQSAGLLALLKTRTEAFGDTYLHDGIHCIWIRPGFVLGKTRRVSNSNVRCEDFIFAKSFYKVSVSQSGHE
jgi:hypothetical protein